MAEQQQIHDFLNEVRGVLLNEVDEEEDEHDLVNALLLDNATFVSICGNGIFFGYTSPNPDCEERILIFVHCSTPLMKHDIEVSDFQFDGTEGEPVKVDLWPRYGLIEKFDPRKYNESVHYFCIEEKLHGGEKWANFLDGGDEHDEPDPKNCILSHKFVIQP